MIKHINEELKKLETTETLTFAALSDWPVATDTEKIKSDIKTGVVAHK